MLQLQITGSGDIISQEVNGLAYSRLFSGSYLAEFRTEQARGRRRMPTEEQTSQEPFHLGEEVFDNDGNSIGKVQARFDRYVLVERGGLFGKTYYLPHTALSKNADGALHLAVSAEELRKQGYNEVPADLYDETPEMGVPKIFSGVPKFAKRPLSPAQTGHYNYGRHWPGINTDAGGSYHRDEVLPIPQKLVEASEENRRKA